MVRLSWIFPHLNVSYKRKILFTFIPCMMWSWSIKWWPSHDEDNQCIFNLLKSGLLNGMTWPWIQDFDLIHHGWGAWKALHTNLKASVGKYEWKHLHTIEDNTINGTKINFLSFLQQNGGHKSLFRVTNSLWHNRSIYFSVGYIHIRIQTRC